MPRLTAAVMDAFSDELEKDAGWGQVGQRLLAAGSHSALGALGGAGLGAAAGGVAGYAGADQGEGLAGALQGAQSGAALGAGVGALGGGGYGLLGGKGAIERSRRLAATPANEGWAPNLGSIAGKVSRFGQRQVHALTGAVPEGFATRSQAVRSIGGGGAQIEQQLKKRTAELARTTDAGRRATLERESASLKKGLEHATHAEETGLTHIPGFMKGLVTKPVDTLRTGLGQAWYGNPGLGGKAMAFGLPAVSIGMGATGNGSKADPTGNPEAGTGERLGREVGNTLPFFTPLGSVAQMGLGSATGEVGGRIGRVIDRARGVHPPPPPTPTEDAASANVQREYSAAALGKPPEGIGG